MSNWQTARTAHEFAGRISKSRGQKRYPRPDVYPTVKRRRVLASLPLVFPVLSGCTGDEGEPSIRDSDGDGVIDSKDYAPKDSAVQEKADLAQTPTIPSTSTATPTIEPTPTPVDTPTATGTDAPTPTGTPTPSPNRSDRIYVTDEYWTDRTRIESYSGSSVEMVVLPESPDADYDDTKVYLAALLYPRGREIAHTYSKSFRRSDGTHRLTLDIDLGDAPTNRRLHYLPLLIPADETIESASPDQVEAFMETDPFVLKSDGRLEKSPHPATLSEENGDGYGRSVVEGSYVVDVVGRTAGKRWRVNVPPFKSAYVEGVTRSRGRSRAEYVSYELTQGTAPDLAAVLDTQAELNGFTEKPDRVHMVIDFVQRLPYVPDDVSKGFDDYTKFIMETLCELGGDCEDSAILLASVLQAQPFNYDTVLIQPPGHMAAGIWGTELSGAYYEYDGRKYYYIETTGEGWGIGDVPEQYSGEEATVYQV